RVVDVQYYGHDQVVTVGMPSGARLRARLSSRRRLTVGTSVALEVRGGEVGTFHTGPPSDGPAQPVELSDKAM
ncbi:MAG TPA: TOBE domain-containing protein, partial [Acidimicrobiales bacterium]|nr:TOBE domain-containing protein [Acidimicrobiales bacterium]